MRNRISSFHTYSKIALWVAIFTLILGGLIFLSSILFPIDLVYGIGATFIVLAFLANVIILLVMVTRLLITPTFKENLFSIYCLLINIPIVVGYIYILSS
ncbi:hypothetical protein SAMN05192588_0096 [Nonlabens sp. Hel1_33_55]|nr:hypothetical protein SAMN05192588_0096 [Nonlabens sp. Hel1_33_55]